MVPANDFHRAYPLNQFQWWQLKNYILDPYRTTKDFYQAIFLKTSVNENDLHLLSVNRDFTGLHKFENKSRYILSELKRETFENSKETE